MGHNVHCKSASCPHDTMERPYILHGTLFGCWFTLTLREAHYCKNFICPPQIAPHKYPEFLVHIVFWPQAGMHTLQVRAFFGFLFQFCYVASLATIPKRFWHQLMTCLWKCVQTVRNWEKKICAKTNNSVEISWNFSLKHFLLKNWADLFFIRERTLWHIDIPFCYFFGNSPKKTPYNDDDPVFFFGGNFVMLPHWWSIDKDI